MHDRTKKLPSEQPHNRSSPPQPGTTWLDAGGEEQGPWAARFRDHGRRLVARHVWKSRRLVFTTIALATAAAIFEGLGIGLIIPLINILNASGGTPFHTGWSWFDVHVLDVAGTQGSRLLRAGGLIVLVSWLRFLFNYMAQRSGVRTTEAILHRIRLEIIDQFQAVSLQFYSRRRTGELLSLLTNEIQRLRQLFSVITSLAVRVLLLVVYVVALFWLSWGLALLALFFFTLLSLCLSQLVRWVRKAARQVSRANSDLTAVAAEFITGIRTITSFGTQAYERSRFEGASADLATLKAETERRRVLVAPLAEAVVATVLVLVIVLGVSVLVQQGTMDVARLLTFLFALLRLLPAVEQINNARAQWAAYQPALTAAADLLRTDDKPYVPDGTRPLDHFRDRITFRHVDFSYTPGHPVLNDICIDIHRGQRVAFIGASGAGKSTLIDLIPRFYDPSAGQVLLDGVDLKEYSLRALRDKIAIVSQDTFLFNDTIGANIAYGRPGVSEEAIREAARDADALPFIDALPQGLDTRLGDRGAGLSGGQRQRLAIARALLRDPEILILDEATSALDSVSEQQVQKSLQRLMDRRTVIIIAHRLSTIKQADLIFVMEAGRIIEQGTYDDLLQRKGQFWIYHSVQNARDVEDVTEDVEDVVDEADVADVADLPG